MYSNIIENILSNVKWESKFSKVSSLRNLVVGNLRGIPQKKLSDHTVEGFDQINVKNAN